jgi:hypothetical protein
MAKKAKTQDEPIVVKDNEITRIARDIVGGAYDNQRVLILTDDIYDSACDDALNRCYSDIESVHMFVAPTFNNYAHAFYGGISRNLFDNYRLNSKSSLDDILKAVKHDFDVFDEIVWSRKIWIYFWLVTAGKAFLENELPMYFGQTTFKESLPYMNRETHPAAVRHLNAHLISRLVNYARNDIFDIIACSYLLYFKTMKALNTSIEIDYDKEKEFFKRRNMNYAEFEKLRNQPPPISQD